MTELQATVVEATHTRAGALCGRLMAELGADVVMVEPPGGHPLRSIDDDEARAEHYFEVFGVGKRSVVVDDPVDEPIFDELVSVSDVFITDREAEAAGPFGEGPIREHNEDVIYCSVTPYGRAGSSQSLAGGDIAVQATSGVTATSGFPDSLPAVSAAPVASTFSAFAACGSIVAAMYAEDPGLSIDVSAQDAVLPLLTTLLPEYFATGEVVERSGNQHPITAPWNAFRAADGWVYVIAYIDRDWERFVDLLGREDLKGDERFESVSRRRKHAEVINAAVAEWVRERTVEEVSSSMESANLTAVAVGDVEDAFEDANLEHRGMVVDSGGHRIAGSPFKMSESPGTVSGSAPTLGEDGESR